MELSEMKILYKSDLSKNYIIIEVDDTSINYKTKMLVENDINGLLITRNIIADDSQQFVYDITSMQSIEVLFGKRKYKSDDVKNIVKGICKAVESISNHFLSMDNIILNTDMIYMNPETGKTSFIYNPFFSVPINRQLEALSIHFLENVDYSDTESINTVYSLNEIISKEQFVIGDIKRVIDKNMMVQLKNEVSYEVEEKEEIHVTNRTTAIWDRIISLLKEKLGFTKKERTPVLICEQKADYVVEDNAIGETVLLSEVGNTRIMFKSESLEYSDIVMEGSSIVIGKLAERVDIIVNNPTISRIHAKCEKEGSRYFLEDLNTTNGTYLNDKKMLPYKLEELKNGDRVKLGQLCYVVVIR